MADAATIPTFLLSQLTKKHVTVILSGEGADELLAGYDKYKFLLYREKFSHLLFSPLFLLMSKIFHKNIKLQRGFDFLSSNGRIEETYLGLTAVFTESEKQKLLGPKLKELHNEVNVSKNIVAKYLVNDRKEGDLLDRLMYLDIKTWLPNDVLLKNDKMTMAHSLEARVPFLDHKFAEFLMTIPSHLKLKGLTEKYIMRKSMEGVVPANIIKRKKHGFTVPIGMWMENGLKTFVEALLTKERITKYGYWDYVYIKSLMNQDLKNEFYKRQLWAIITFEVWHKIFIENEKPI